MASTALIRVDTKTRDLLAKMAEQDQTSIGEVAAKAVKKLDRDRFWKSYNDAYAKLRADPEAWAEYEAEIRLWDSTLMDGLEEYPYDYGDEDE
jgi:hypothetical protein